MRRMVSSLAVVGLAIVAVAPGQARAANLATLVNFNGLDGANPQASLITDANGNLFGTTANGGASGRGTVFEIAKTADGYASTPTTLISFSGADGQDPPEGSLIADANGNLFGTTTFGGASGLGTVFEIAKTADGYAGTPTTLVNFCSLANCADGFTPVAGLIIDASGNLFGTTLEGGAHSGGTVFEIAKTAGGYASTPTVLVSFCAQANCADGARPVAGLITDVNGNLFGATFYGGAFGGPTRGGTVFEIAKTTGGYASTPTTLVSFCALANCADGSNPRASLIADANGNLFGTTEGGGANGFGTVFEIAKTADGYASTPAILVSFNGPDGANPHASLIADANGNLFGTTATGGAFGGRAIGGTVFEIAKTADGYASTPITLVNFCALANCADGSNPFAGLIADANGNLFGTTFYGGANNIGTVFEITDTGFVVRPIFAGTPGKPNCFGKSVSALVRQYGGLNAAAAALGYSSVRALQDAILVFCEDCRRHAHNDECDEEDCRQHARGDCDKAHDLGACRRCR